MIPRHRLILVFVFLVPLLALRATLPAGFVPSVDSHARRIVALSAGLADLEAPANDLTIRELDGPPDGAPDASAAMATAPQHDLAAGAAIPGFRAKLQVALRLSPSAGPPREAGARAPPKFL